jgi:hypothetical protein
MRVRAISGTQQSTGNGQSIGPELACRPDIGRHYKTD